MNVASEVPTGRDIDDQVVVAKIKGDGSAIIFSKTFGGTRLETVRGIATDPQNNVYVTGETGSSDFPAVAPIQSVHLGLFPDGYGSSDAYVAKFDGQSGDVLFATNLGGSSTDSPVGIGVDTGGNIYIGGRTNSTDFPLRNPVRPSGFIFVAKIAEQGTGLIPQVTAVTNAASYSARAIAPGEIVSIFGIQLAATTASANQLPLPTQLSNVQVMVNGVSAPLLYVSPQQINAQIPVDSTGFAQLQVITSGGNVARSSFAIAPAVPGIFTTNWQGTGPGAIAHSATGQLVTAENPAVAGETITIYSTGLGVVSPVVATGNAPAKPQGETVLPVTAAISGTSARVVYAGLAPSVPGLYQVDAQVPAGVAAGVQPLQIVQNGALSNIVTLAVR